MRTGKKALLAAGMIAAAAVMTGCSAGVAPVNTPTPQAQKMTAQPATAQPAQTDGQQSAPQTDGGAQEAGEAEQSAQRLELTVDQEDVPEGALREEGRLLVPLIQTAQALGWNAESEQTQEETQTKRVVTLDKEDSRITVSWTVSDNTARNIVWQKDGLLIPVDTRITTMEETVYVPAAFFEEAADVTISTDGDRVRIAKPEAKSTPETAEQEPEGNG